MSDTNKTIVRRFFDEVFNQQSQAAAAQLIDPALVVHHPPLPRGSGGTRDVVQMAREFREGFPDLSSAVEDVVAEGDRVAARWTARGAEIDLDPPTFACVGGL